MKTTQRTPGKTPWRLLLLALAGLTLVAAGRCRTQPPPAREEPATPTVAAPESVKKAVPPDLKVEIRAVALQEPVQYLAEDGAQRQAREIVEFQLTTSTYFPARALDPVLAVGARLVTRYRYLGPGVLLFTEYEPERLEDGSPVVFQWGRDPVPSQRQELGVAYHRRETPPVSR